MSPSFTHILNPFVCPPDSEHGIASRVTYASLARATRRPACAHRQRMAAQAEAIAGHRADGRTRETPAGPEPLEP